MQITCDRSLTLFSYSASIIASFKSSSAVQKFANCDAKNNTLNIDRAENDAESLHNRIVGLIKNSSQADSPRQLGHGRTLLVRSAAFYSTLRIALSPKLAAE